MTWIQTNSGRALHFLSPHPDDFILADIAHGLSNAFRFSGQSDYRWSVLHHSILVAAFVPEEFVLEALLHDAAEAFLGDIASPIKQVLPQYQLLENRLLSVICEKYGARYPIPECVHEADRHAVFLEAELVYKTPPIGDWHLGYKNPKMLPVMPKAIHNPNMQTLFMKKVYALAADRGIVLSEMRNGGKKSKED